jgi:RsiW-degrading membrane proteinase PrsW (M82 family)
LLAGTIVIDVVVILVWYYLMSRLDNVGVDDPVAPDDRQLDLNDPASWYVVQVPGLTKSLTVVAVACLIGIVVGAAALLPVVSIRYEFLI